MTLGDKQRLMARLGAQLITKMFRDGHAVTLGAALRTGPKERLHKLKLAQDLNLFKRNPLTGSWIYMRSTEAHLVFGEWWEQQHELCRWGGRFSDGNHYSIAHRGMR